MADRIVDGTADGVDQHLISRAIAADPAPPSPKCQTDIPLSGRPLYRNVEILGPLGLHFYSPYALMVISF
jgi:hypothetical protein